MSNDEDEYEDGDEEEDRDKEEDQDFEAKKEGEGEAIGDKHKDREATPDKEVSALRGGTTYCEGAGVATDCGTVGRGDPSGAHREDLRAVPLNQESRPPSNG